jgi:nicotinamidase-related amidase
MILSNVQSQLLVIDVQEKLAPAMSDAGPVIANSAKLIAAARHFGAPVTLSEQYPKGIGPTVAALREAAGDGASTFDKMAFSCARDEAICGHLGLLREGRTRRQIVLTGIEAHVCVLQTALDLRQTGYEVFVVADAIASRETASRDLALARMQQAGVHAVTTEMVIFEWLGRAGTPDFKALLPLIK